MNNYLLPMNARLLRHENNQIFVMKFIIPHCQGMNGLISSTRLRKKVISDLKIRLEK